jgi:endonuclease-3 related protein
VVSLFSFFLQIPSLRYNDGKGELRMWRKIYQRLDAYHTGFDVDEWWGIHEPFERMVGSVLVQHTTWSNAAKALENIKATGLHHPQAIASLACDDLIPVIRSAGFQTSKAETLIRLSRWLLDKGGVMAIKHSSAPTEALRIELLNLRGIGEETADTILAYVFGRPTISGDAYSRRLYERLTGEKLRYAQIRQAILAELTDTSELQRLHGLIVEHGKIHCRKNSPRCDGCPLQKECSFSLHSIHNKVPASEDEDIRQSIN